MTTREEIIALRNECDEVAEETLQCKGEFHPDYHTVSDERFYTIAHEAGASRRDAEIEEYASVLLKIRKTLCGSVNNTDDILELAATVKQERDQLRAELEAARAEIERLQAESDPEALHIAYLHGQADRNQKLAAAQAKNVGLLDELNRVKSICLREFGNGVVNEVVLSTPSDTTALEALVNQAGDVMRERSINVAWNNEPDCNGPIEMEIRALPAVTFDDLKGGA